MKKSRKPKLLEKQRGGMTVQQFCQGIQFDASWLILRIEEALGPFQGAAPKKHLGRRNHSSLRVAS